MTNLKEAQSYRLFDMLDLDKSGQMEFDEFYVLMCILIAIKVRVRPLAVERISLFWILRPAAPRFRWGKGFVLLALARLPRAGFSPRSRRAHGIQPLRPRR